MNDILLDVTVEIAKDSQIKYEYNRFDNTIHVDRILWSGYSYPQNYGFIPNTLDYDGDELDALIISDQSFMVNVKVPTKILGVMKMIDNGEYDYKLIGVIDCDPRYKHINSFDDIPKHLLEEIVDFFQNYKLLQKKSVNFIGWEKEEYAKKIIKECKNLFEKYKDYSKKDFLTLMKKQYPGKYC